MPALLVARWAVMSDERASDGDVKAAGDELLARWMRNPVFAAAGEPRCRALAASCPSRLYPSGALLLEQGDPSDHVQVVLEGTVRIFHRAADGREVLVKLLRAPCVFGDLELLADLPLVKNVAAVEQVQLALVPQQVFIELLRGCPAAMEALLKQVAAAYCVAIRNQRQVFASVEQRLANLLLSYAEFYGQAEDDGLLIGEKLSQQQLALSLGTTRRSVAKVLGEWSAKGLVSRRDERHLIHRVDKLEELAASLRGSLNYQMGMSVGQVASRETLSEGLLEVQSGPDEGARGRCLPIEGELTVGRARDNQLTLADERVDRRHCRVYRGATGPRFWVEDLGSADGTRVNGEPITRAVLREDDLIEVGSTTVLFRLASPDEAE
jgi:CRP/FNR family cyclic AMP-dependent transcriptional regulator